MISGRIAAYRQKACDSPEAVFFVTSVLILFGMLVTVLQSPPHIVPIQGNDFIGKASRPHLQQPYYLMPVFFAVKLTLTVLAFGFSVNFKPTKKTWMKWVGKQCAALFFIALTLNGYVTDFRRLKAASKDASSVFEGLQLFLATFVTSSNYVAARAFWGTLSIENPKRLFRLVPKYRALPIRGGIIPLMPGSAHFLPLLKHIYAYLLLPYDSMTSLSTLLMPPVISGWAIVSKCFCCCFTWKFSCCFTWSLVLVGFSLGLWPWARQCSSYWFSIGWPVLYLGLIQFWAAIISPMLFASLYGVLTGSSCEDIRKGVLPPKVRRNQEGQTPLLDNAESKKIVHTRTLTLEEVDRKALIAINWDDLEHDFEMPADLDKKATSESLMDAKIMIFKATLVSMGNIVIVQFGILFWLRAFFTHDSTSYIATLQRTAMERTMGSYLGSLKEMARSDFWKMENMMQHLGAASYYLDIVWKIL